ncbi:MAG: hypothetical protein WCH98_21125, partial [Verrucomicrobiota bacterium]
VYFFSDFRFWNRERVERVAISWRRCPSIWAARSAFPAGFAGFLIFLGGRWGMPARSHGGAVVASREIPVNPAGLLWYDAPR